MNLDWQAPTWQSHSTYRSAHNTGCPGKTATRTAIDLKQHFSWHLTHITKYTIKPIFIQLIFIITIIIINFTWRRSVVKSEGIRVTQVKPSNLKPTETRFCFRRRKLAIWSFSACSVFGRKWIFIFVCSFSFQKMSFALDQKCYVSCEHTGKFCDIRAQLVTFVFVFWPRKEFHFRRHFRLRPKIKNTGTFSVGLYIRLHPTSMIFKHSTILVLDSLVGALKN